MKTLIKMKLLSIILLGIIVTIGWLANVSNLSLISAWNLNGDYLDATVNHYDGSGSFSPSVVDESSESGHGSSAGFKSSHYIALEQAFSGTGSLPELTDSVWFKTTASGDWQSNWALLDLDRLEFFNMFASGKGEAGFSTTSSNSIDDMYSSMNGLNDANWHHLAVTYGHSVGKNLDVDASFGSLSPSTRALDTSATRYSFIGDGSEASYFNAELNKLYYSGLISEVKLLDSVFNVAEVMAQVSTPSMLTVTAQVSKPSIFATMAQVPEPSTLAIFALGIMGLVSRRFNKHS